MHDGDWTDDYSRRQIRERERFSRRPEDFQTLIQAEPVPVPFAWNTPASRAFLKAAMDEVEAEVAANAKWAHAYLPSDAKRKELDEAWTKACVERHRAFEVLCSEMRDEVEWRLGG